MKIDVWQAIDPLCIQLNQWESINNKTKLELYLNKKDIIGLYRKPNALFKTIKFSK